MPFSEAAKSLALARARATKADYESFSDIPNVCSHTTSLKENYLRNLLTLAYGPSVANSPKMRFVAVNSDNLLTVLHSPMPWHSDATGATTIAVVGDDIHSNISVRLAPDSLVTVTVLLATHATAHELLWKDLPRLPMECRNKKEAADGVLRADTPKVTAPALGFVDQHPNAPVFAVVPTAYPLAPGDKFPFHGREATLALTPEEGASLDPALLAWIEAIRVTLDCNKEACNSKVGLIFDPKEVTTYLPDEDGGEGTPTALPSEVLTKLGSRLSESIKTKTTAIYPESAPAKAVFAGMVDSVCAKMGSLPDLDSVPAVASADTPAATNPFAVAINDLSATMGGLIKSQSSSTASSNTKPLLKYQALFGRSEITADGSKVFTLATATPEFTEVLQESNKAARNQLLREHIRCHQDIEVNKGGVGSLMNFNLEVMTDQFCTQLLNHGWNMESLSCYKGALDKELILFNFLQPNTDSSFWQTLLESDLAVRADDLHEPDIKKHRRKPRQLYCGGHMTTPEHLVTALANFLLFATYMVTEPEKSPLIEMFRHRITTYRSSVGRKYISSMIPRYPHLIHSLLMDNQNVLTHFLSSTSGNPSLVARLKKKEVVPAADTIDAAVANAKFIYTAQNVLCTSGNLGNYTTPDITFQAIKKQQTFDDGALAGDKRATTPSDDGGGSPAKKAKGGGKGGKSDGKKDRDDQPKASDELIATLKSQGYFEFIPAKGQKPRLPHSFSGAKAGQAKMCNGHAYINIYCTRGMKCAAYHVPLDWNKVSKADKAVMCQYVEANKAHVRWVKGKGPNNPSESKESKEDN